MIIVNFENNEEYKKAYGLWQYDYGQVLRIQGLNLPTAAEIHFALREAGGEAVTRIGITKDGVTDVAIPDSLLEADGTSQDYQIYVFVYLANPDSGETTRRITLGVKSRPRPEAFNTPGEGELFEEAIQAVNDAAKRAEEAGKEATAAAGEAREFASRAGKHLADTQALAEQVEINADAVAQGTEKAKELLAQTQEVASNAVASAQAAKQAEMAAREAQTAAESAEDAARQYAAGTEADRQEVAESKQSVAQIQSNVARMQADVQADREAVEQTVSEFGQTTQDALTALGQAQNTAVSAVQTEGQKQATAVHEAGAQAIDEIDTAKTAAVGAVASEGDKQVVRVQEAAAEIVSDREQIQHNKAYIATLTDKTNTLAPGIVLDARGKQIIISDASEQPFVGLNVYGKSTQVKTTGVNLANGMDNVYKKEQSGQQKLCYCWGYSLGGGPLILDKPLKAGTYTFSFYSDTAASVYLAKAPYVTGQFIQYSVNQKVTGDIKNGLQRYFCPFQLTDERDLIGIYSEGYTTCFGGMINFGDKPLPYEPYTGGKPSPSPEYPQEIANAGDNGNIKVEVTGRNLFPLIEDNIVKNSPLTATINSDGSISIYGTPLKRYESVFTTQLIDFHPGTYYLGGDIFEKGKLIVQLNIARNDDSVEYISNKSFELKKDDKKRSLSIQYSNAELIPVNQIIYPLLVYGAENVPFEPYKPAQTLTLKTPNGLAGIPTKGNGNYTDENGQQWICDTIECRDGIAEYVQRIGEIVVNSDAHIAADLADYGALQENTVIGRYFNESIKKETAILCKELQIIENWSNDKESARTVEKGIDFRLSRERIGLGTETTNEQNKTAILKFLETTPLHFVVQLDTPIRTPLTQEEMAAYKALHTYSPNTTVVNDAGCGMSLTYIADTQRYIDKKIAAISAAMIGG